MKKFNSKILLIILVSLGGIYFLTKVIKGAHSEGSLSRSFGKLDSASITKIVITPKGGKSKDLTFEKKGELWFIQQDKLSVEADTNSLKRLLLEIIKLKPQRLAAKSKEAWKEYQVEDTSATRLKVYEAGDLKMDLMIGKFSFKQNQNPYSQYGGGGGGGNNVSATTFIRSYKETEIYAVEGFIAMALSQDFNSWRNQKFLLANKADLNRIIFNYPSDSSFSITRKDSVTWLIDAEKPDSASMENLLNQISYKMNQSFIDGYKPVGSPAYKVTIEGKNMSPIVVQAFRIDNSTFALNSNLNPNAYFSSSLSETFADIFVSRKAMLKKEKKKGK